MGWGAAWFAVFPGAVSDRLIAVPEAALLAASADRAYSVAWERRPTAALLPDMGIFTGDRSGGAEGEDDDEREGLRPVR